MKISPYSIFLTLATLVLLSGAFCIKLVQNKSILSISNFAGINVYLMAIAIALICSFAAFYFISTVIEIIIYSDLIDAEDIFNDNLFLDRIFLKYSKIMFFIGFAVLVVCSINSYFWLDEAFTLKLINHSYIEGIHITAADVHPPLYYIILKFFIDLFSHISTDLVFTVIIAKLFSVAAYALTALICWYKLKDEKPKYLKTMLIVCLFSVPKLIGYGIEIRMYSWALFFVTATYLYAKDIIDRKSNFGRWVLLAFFTLCSAYTHYYALVAAAAVWLYLLIWLINYDRKSLIKWFVFGFISAICYLPWLLVLLKQMEGISGDYWISNITLTDVLGYFKIVFPNYLFFMFMTAFIMSYIIYNMNNLKEVFYECIGLLIPVTVIAVGILSSLIFRPVFIGRYIVPGGLCLYISILFIWRKSSDIKRLTVVGIIAVSFIFSCTYLLITEIQSAEVSDNSVDFIASMPEDSVICVDQNVTSHILGTMAAYTDKQFYSPETDSQLKRFWDVYENIEFINVNDILIEKLLDSEKIVYYVCLDTENGTVIPHKSNFNIEFVGEYVFENKVDIYKISPVDADGGRSK